VHYGNDMKYPPLALAILPFEAESGKTYFFFRQPLLVVGLCQVRAPFTPYR
jgi:hypothetical protein